MNFLLIEDSDFDAKLVECFFREACPHGNFVRVATAEEAYEQIDRGNWASILCDRYVPGGPVDLEGVEWPVYVYSGIPDPKKGILDKANIRRIVKTIADECCASRPTVLPASCFADARNAARMTVFAEAAYWGDVERPYRDLFCQEMKYGKVQWWVCENASGVVYVDDDNVCIGVAGTNDHGDLRNDVDLFAQGLSDWGSATGIRVASDSFQCRSTAGFLAYTALVYAGIKFSLTSLDIKMQDSRTVWLAGHSLGGAAVQLLQCTDDFEDSRAFVYGCPRAFKGHWPTRQRVSVRRLTDPVTYFPRTYQHARAHTLFVNYPGSVRNTIPPRFYPAATALTAAAWAKNLVAPVLRRLGVPLKGSLVSGHSMSRYKSNLWALR